MARPSGYSNQANIKYEGWKTFEGTILCSCSNRAFEHRQCLDSSSANIIQQYQLLRKRRQSLVNPTDLLRRACKPQQGVFFELPMFYWWHSEDYDTN